MRIWYDKLASKRKVRGGQRADKVQNRWQQQALPLGNGSLGLSMFGEPFAESIVVNEKSLWTGGPSPKRPNYCGGNLEYTKDGKKTVDVFNEVRKELSNGRNADELCEKLVGDTDGYGSYQVAGILKINGQKSKFSNYNFQLDLDSASSKCGWRQADGEYERKAFVSYPDKVAVISQKGETIGDWDILWENKTVGKSEIKIDGSRLLLKGSLEDNGLAYAMSMKVESDGEIIPAANGWKLKGTKSFSVIFTYVTDYKDDYPRYRTDENVDEVAARSENILEGALDKSLQELESRHIEDWRHAYGGFEFSLGAVEPSLSTDKLLAKYAKASDNDRKWLETLLFAYGRYLLVASSRSSDILPCNLQGIWNISNSPAWGSDYHLNINLQMNYWLAPLCGLAECAEPLVRYLEKLREPGRVTASVYCGIGDGKSESGYLYHTQNTPFGWTCPGWEFKWGWSAAAVAWILHNIYELYLFGKDKAYLKRIYPLLKEASYTYDALVDKSGDRWVTSPCFSPEHGPITHGNVYEQVFVQQLYIDLIEAATALGEDKDKIEYWKEVCEKLKPLELGNDGQLKEWYHETTLGSVGEKKHRHVSHLMALYPCALIDVEEKSLLDGVRISLEDRGDKSTGWATALRLCLWARLNDGERAYKLVERLIKNNIYQNLWDTHPPFQIDGNFGYAAGVCELLVHSHSKVVKLLPTLPPRWKNGLVKGLGVRGGYILDMEWKDGSWTELKIISKVGGDFVFYCDGDIKVVDGDGKEVAVDREENTASFKCAKLGRYVVTRG
ncbi:MAG: glycoside hydrolase family 95 protein [Clostridia bacterium]|nr:glycoside hydrolase family 95 protein [Clostridia bacterium]MDE7329068.1 glycoside hydrolase family 95 protein [Clostridia bacterium]